MFKVVTKNSVYQVAPAGAGFVVSRVADLWGRKVTDKHTHATSRITLAVGEPFITSNIRTSAVLAVIPA